LIDSVPAVERVRQTFAEGPKLLPQLQWLIERRTKMLSDERIGHAPESIARQAFRYSVAQTILQVRLTTDVDRLLVGWSYESALYVAEQLSHDSPPVNDYEVRLNEARVQSSIPRWRRPVHWEVGGWVAAGMSLAPVCSSDVHRRACGSRDGVPLTARSGRKWLQWRTGCHGGSSPSPGTGNRTRTKNPKAQRDGCLYEKLNSTIMVVKATDDGRRCDAALMLDGTRAQPLHNPDITSFWTSASWAETLLEGNSLASK
jgi:hypothetical protein